MGAPRTGPCAPWTSAEDVQAQPWVAKAITSTVDAGTLTDLQVQAILATSALAASEILYNRRADRL